jgi:hypothetical protein
MRTRPEGRHATARAVADDLKRHRLNLLSLHIEYFLRGIMAGHPDCWRAHVLHRLPAKAKRLFPDDNGLVVTAWPEHPLRPGGLVWA